MATETNRLHFPRIRIGVPLLGLIWLAVTTLPFIFVVVTSLKTQEETFSEPVWALPTHVYFGNYWAVLNGPYLTYFSNSVFVVGVSVLLIMLLSAMAAYVFARLRFRLNKVLFGLMIAGMIVPLHSTLVPIYLLTRNLGLYDTQFALIGPYVALSLPISIFILTEFMRQIPHELEEAAQLDGCGPFKIFWRIFFPLSTPLAVWDFQGHYSSNIPAMLAVVTMTSLPLIAAYAFGQERLIKGMMAGSLKG
jgi:raffinose/stachyose/melibiose transport system permease protein